MRYWQLSPLILLIAASAAPGDEEDFLDWSEIHIVGEDREDTGRVSFRAKARGGTWREVRAEAFGKEYILGEQQRGLLKGFPLSSIQTTHSGGYEQLGGRTVIFRFSRSFYRDGKLVRSEVAIAISRGKGLRMSEPHELTDRVEPRKEERPAPPE